MRTIAISSSILGFWQDLVFLEAALLTDPETKGLATLIPPVLDELPAILQRDLDTRRRVVGLSRLPVMVRGGGCGDAGRGAGVCRKKVGRAPQKQAAMSAPEALPCAR